MREKDCFPPTFTQSESGTDVSRALPTPADKRQLQGQNGAADSMQLSLGMFSLAPGKKRGLQTKLLTAAVSRCRPADSSIAQLLADIRRDV